MSLDAGKAGLEWRDVVSYALAALTWIVLAAMGAVALRAVHSTVGPLVLAILFDHPYYQTHSYQLGDRAGVADRIALALACLTWIVYVFMSEEYLRSGVGEARALRLRQASAGVQPARDWRSRGLGALARRALVVAGFPAAMAVLYLVLQLAIWLLLRA